MQNVINGLSTQNKSVRCFCCNCLIIFRKHRTGIMIGNIPKSKVKRTRSIKGAFRLISSMDGTRRTHEGEVHYIRLLSKILCQYASRTLLRIS